jgi:uncharacterized protein YecT (DUF1311 family)
MRGSFVFAVAGMCGIFAAHSLPAQSASKAQSLIIPEDWLPALAPSIKFALAQLKDANSQAEMNSLSRQVADMTDAQLFIAYVRLYERLPPKERSALRAEQTSWLAKRVKAAREGVESEGGSLAPLEANNVEVTLSEKRLADLRARLKSVEKKKKPAADDESDDE